jgi:hypothetical protein
MGIGLVIFFSPIEYKTQGCPGHTSRSAGAKATKKGLVQKTTDKETEESSTSGSKYVRGR